MAIIGALLGAGLQYMQQRDANDRQKDAIGLEQQKFDLNKGFADRLQALNQLLMDRVQAAERGGLFDPEAAAKRYETDTLKRQERQTQILGAGLANAGYSGGDSEVRYQLGKATARNERELQTGMEDARRGSLVQLLGAYNATNPATLSSAGNLIGQSNASQMLWNSGQQMQPDWASYAQSVVPYLGRRKQNNGSWGGPGNDASGGTDQSVFKM